MLNEKGLSKLKNHRFYKIVYNKKDDKIAVGEEKESHIKIASRHGFDAEHCFGGQLRKRKKKLILDDFTSHMKSDIRLLESVFKDRFEGSGYIVEVYSVF